MINCSLQGPTVERYTRVMWIKSIPGWFNEAGTSELQRWCWYHQQSTSRAQPVQKSPQTAMAMPAVTAAMTAKARDVTRFTGGTLLKPKP
jgi:hypothetical protein